MSMELMASSERVCYVHCNLCNTILAVSVPAVNSLLTATATATVVTVRCGHCANLLSVNIGAASLQYYSLPSPNPSPTTGTAHPHAQHYHSHPNLHTLQKHHQVSSEDSSSNKDYGSSSSSSTSSKFTAAASAFNQASTTTTTTVDQPRLSPIRPPEKRQRVPSAYNRFIKEEIQRIKASNPDISHREAFSTAAKNWAHFPHIHFGLKLESNKQAKLDHQAFAGDGTQKSTNGFY